jgi:hypothetical protein
MPEGPGKYDEECEGVLKSTNAIACILLVLGGDKGNGFEVASTEPGLKKEIPKLLREMADQIEHETKNNPPHEGPEGRRN